MKIRIEEDILSGTGAEIMDQLRARVFDPRSSPDTESYIWFLRNNVVRTTGLDFPLPEGDVEQQARMMFLPVGESRCPHDSGGLIWRNGCILPMAAISIWSRWLSAVPPLKWLDLRCWMAMNCCSAATGAEPASLPSSLCLAARSTAFCGS